MRGSRSLIDTAVEAVAEVGNPTIVATLTIIAALLPMMFVSGLMGPYMSPIPANASLAMVFSFFVAMTITPWLLLKIAGRRFEQERGDGVDHAHQRGAMGDFYVRVATPLLQGRKRSQRFLLGVGLATLLSMGLFVTKTVRVKLLPFDNKSEIAVVVDLPRGASLEETDRVLTA
ncbi:MAG: efflux RND transporter permease subunit [Methylocystis sp.]